MNDPTIENFPVGGVDYPQTIQEFDEWFSTEEACTAYLLKLRWPNGFVCPACGGTKGWMTDRQQVRCAGCQRQTSVTAGTIFDGTRKPLRMWFKDERTGHFRPSRLETVSNLARSIRTLQGPRMGDAG